TSTRRAASCRPQAARWSVSRTPASATWGSARTPTATRSSCTGGTRPVADRTNLLERYRALPLPDTSMEAWRFTDLAGFDPDAFAAPNGHVEGQTPAVSDEGMLEIDAAAVAMVGGDGVEVGAVPEGVTFEPLTDDAERLGTLVGADDKFTAHNAALWKHGLLVRVAKGVALEKPLYVRIASTAADASLFWRLLVVAEEGSRFSLVEEYVAGSPDLSAYSNAAVELFVEQSAKLEYVSVQNYSVDTWHFATHHARVERDAELDWVAGGF